MFGRRRRTRAAIPAPVAPAPPELTGAQVFEHLHAALADLVGADGAWTLVPRSEGDTDVIFHDLKAKEIAMTLTGILTIETVRLRTETTLEPANVAEPCTVTPIDPLTARSGPVDTGAVLVSSGAEPTALPWTPAPISVWAEPAAPVVPAAADRTGTPRPGRLVA